MNWIHFSCEYCGIIISRCDSECVKNHIGKILVGICKDCAKVKLDLS